YRVAQAPGSIGRGLEDGVGDRLRVRRALCRARHPGAHVARLRLVIGMTVPLERSRDEVGLEVRRLDELHPDAVRLELVAGSVPQPLPRRTRRRGTGTQTP